MAEIEPELTAAERALLAQRTFFNELTGFGEKLLGEALWRVLKKSRPGAWFQGSNGLSGWKLLEAADRLIKEDRPEQEQLRSLKEDMSYVLEHVEHSQRYGRVQSCFCKELVSGEHAADPICSVCSLRAAEVRLKKVLA